MRKRPKLRFAEWSGRHLGKAYVLGLNDCLSLAIDFCEHVGIEVPDEFEGVTRDGYASFYKEAPGTAFRIFCRWIATIADRIDPAFIFTGDLMIVRPKSDGETKGEMVVIHSGGDRIMGAFHNLGRIDYSSVRAYDILRAYRLKRS